MNEDLLNLLKQINNNLARIANTLESLDHKTPHQYQQTPDGLPICPKHGVPMQKREKQGDTWFSHKVTDANGNDQYCRGHAGPNSPGYQASVSGDNLADQLFAYRYGDGTQVATDNDAERTAFNSYRRAHQERPPMSRAVLRQWYSSK